MKISLTLTALISCALIVGISGKSPILLVPGLMGTRLEAKVEYKIECLGKSFVWVNLAKPLCAQVLEMHFNQNNREFSKMEKVKVTTPKIGDFSAVECLDYKVTVPVVDLDLCAQKYLLPFLHYFTHEVNRKYVKGRDLIVAPYDWRLSPYELKLQGYFDKVKTKIEMMFYTNGMKRITIVAHSYGGVVMLYFLRNVVEQDWKDKHIKAFIPLGSPFGGATKIVGALVYGRLPFEIPFEAVRIFVSRQLRPAMRTFPSLYFLAPRHHVFWDKTLLKRGRESYTSLNYDKIFNYRLGFSRYQATLDHNMHYHPGDPGVSTYCMFGTSIETPDWYGHRGNFDYYEDKDSHGDGTVDKESLEVCAKWPRNRVAEVHRLRGVEHLSIVSNRTVLNAINRIVNL